jgi:hypothetical protein
MGEGSKNRFPHFKGGEGSKTRSSQFKGGEGSKTKKPRKAQSLAGKYIAIS